jgi:hypothetical protein
MLSFLYGDCTTSYSATQNQLQLLDYAIEYNCTGVLCIVIEFEGWKKATGDIVQHNTNNNDSNSSLKSAYNYWPFLPR